MTDAGSEFQRDGAAVIFVLSSNWDLLSDELLLFAYQ